MAEPVQFVDRKSGALVTERVFGDSALRRIYGPGFASAALRALMSRPLMSFCYGRLQRRAGSRKKIRGFVDSLGIDASEAERPLDDYATLDEFFTRRLRAGARPIDDEPTRLCSPADGRALAFAGLDAGAALPIKGQSLSLATLVGAPLPFARAAVLVVRLAPADYHRFHAPCAGLLSAPRRMGGPLHSVHPRALAAGAPSFANRREVSQLDSQPLGTLLLVEVGAMLVGEIERTRAPGPVAKGEELGMFHFGGSTVVLLADDERVQLDPDLLANSARGLETRVQMGERVGATRVHAAPPSGEQSRR